MSLKETHKYFSQHRFLLLLLFLLSIIAIPPFLEKKLLRDLFITVNYTLIILSGLYAFSENVRFLSSVTVIFILAIAVEWLSFFRGADNYVKMTQVGFLIVVFATLLVKSMKAINSSRQADLNIIFGAIAGYILIAYIGGFLTMAISIGYPDAFNIPGPISSLDGIYFSFVTMTTLGYGDITPVSSQARAVAILLSIIGPMYVAILISMLVGKYSSKSFGKS